MTAWLNIELVNWICGFFTGLGIGALVETWSDRR